MMGWIIVDGGKIVRRMPRTRRFRRKIILFVVSVVASLALLPISPLSSSVFAAAQEITVQISTQLRVTAYLSGGHFIVQPTNLNIGPVSSGCRLEATVKVSASTTATVKNGVYDVFACAQPDSNVEFCTLVASLSQMSPEVLVFSCLQNQEEEGS